MTQSSSEVRDALELASEWLTDTMLISAYDLAHGHIPRPDELPATPELIILDSGGYEMRIEHNMSAAVHSPHQPLPWDRDRYRKVLDEWPERFPACFVSYDQPDDRSPLEDQVRLATELLSPYSKQLHTLLLKPETPDQVDMSNAIARVGKVAGQLAPFHFIGVTEKELGISMLDRMHHVAQLRLALDEAQIRAPLHIFGALDPLTCILLFLSGAEVFDGLTWLRYAFHKGMCVYPSNYGAFCVGTWRRDAHVRARILTDNVHYLQNLAMQMQTFLLDRDFRKFEHHADFLATEYDRLRARLGGGI